MKKQSQKKVVGSKDFGWDKDILGLVDAEAYGEGQTLSE
jgi:hypothetical protein